MYFIKTFQSWVLLMCYVFYQDFSEWSASIVLCISPRLLRVECFYCVMYFTKTSQSWVLLLCYVFHQDFSELNASNVLCISSITLSMFIHQMKGVWQSIQRKLYRKKWRRHCPSSMWPGWQSRQAWSQGRKRFIISSRFKCLCSSVSFQNFLTTIQTFVSFHRYFFV